MPKEYVLPAISGGYRDVKPTKMLTTRITKLEKYRRIDWKFRIMWESISGTYFYGVNRKILRRSSNLEIMSYGFPKEKKHIWANF